MSEDEKKVKVRYIGYDMNNDTAYATLSVACHGEGQHSGQRILRKKSERNELARELDLT